MKKESGPYITEAKAHAIVASICLSYMCFRCFDQNIADDDVDAYIKSGDYVLNAYTQSYWLRHVYDALKEIDGTDENTVDQLNQFFRARWDPSPRNHCHSNPSQQHLVFNSLDSVLDKKVIDALNTVAHFEWKQSMLSEPG